MPLSQISTRAGAVLALRDLALEGGVVERVVLDVDGERALAGLERHALRHRPARERAVALEAEVVVEPPGVVALDDEDRLAVPRFLRRANGSECAADRACGGTRSGRASPPIPTVPSNSGLQTVRPGSKRVLKQWKTRASCRGKACGECGISQEKRGSYAKTPIPRNLARRRRTSSLARHPFELARAPRRATPSSSRAASFQSFWAPPARLRDDPVDHAELEAVRGIGLEGGGGLPRLAGVAPQDRGAALRRDHRVDRVLLHQHAVGERDRDRAARAALADHARHDRHLAAAPSAPATRAIAPPWPCCSAATPG